MITVHHLNNSRSQRILWMLEELQLPYEIAFYERNKETMLAPDSLKAIHPLGKSPILTDADQTIAESGAIIEYLGRAYSNGNLRPEESTQQHLNYQYWLHFAEGTMMPPLLLMLVMQKIHEKAQPFFIKPVAHAIAAKVSKEFITPNLTRQLAFIETHLKLNEWFAGDNLTGADIQMSFPLEAARFRGLCENHRAINDYLQRIHSRAAYQNALKKGGDYAYA